MLIKFQWSGKQFDLTTEEISITSDNFSVDENGNMSCSNADITGGQIDLTGAENNTVKIYVHKENGTMNTSVSPGGFLLREGSSVRFWANSTLTAIRSADGTGTIISGGYIQQQNDLEETTISSNASSGNITCVSLTQTSLEKIKKNIQESNINALELIKRAKIYEYNLKTEQDEDKKHIGFVIGDKYETPKEVISQSGEGIDTYTMTSIMWKAIQEQQKIIEDLQKEIKLLKGEKDE